MNNFISSFQEFLKPQIISLPELKVFPDVIYIRKDQRNEGKKFFFFLKDGILHLKSFQDGNEISISKNLKNVFFQMFENHLSLFGEEILFEITILNSDIFSFEDVFTSFSHPINTARKRFAFLQKLFRETQINSLFNFNLPFLKSPHEIIEKEQYKGFDLFPFTSSTPLKVETTN